MSVLKNIFSPKEFTGWHMFGVLFLFFGTIITVNMVLAYNAGATWTGLVVKNTYVESQKFNDRQAVIQKQMALGWQMDVGYADGSLNLSLKDANGQFIEDAIVTAKVGHPVQESNDHFVEFSQGANTYVSADKLTPGMWQAHFDIIGPSGETVQKTMRFVVADKGA